MSFIVCDWLEGSHGLVWNYTGVLHIMELIKMWQVFITAQKSVCDSCEFLLHVFFFVTFHNLPILNIEGLLDRTRGPPLIGCPPLLIQYILSFSPNLKAVPPSMT
jgi:hypothetical protein